MTSDQIFTKPTLPMLEAIIGTSLGDSEFEEDSTTISFQKYVASLLGHHACLLAVSGTMGNQMALRAALKTPPFSLVTDSRSHILSMEGGGAAAACGAMIRMVSPSEGHYLTLDDIKKACVLEDLYFACPTRVISLENPLRGIIMPISEVRAIAQWARTQTPPIHMHLDGARIWEAVAAEAFTLKEIGECFDSIQLCLTKGLGAPLGSVVVGSLDFIERAKWSRKFLGGTIRAGGIIAAPARVAIENVFLGGKLKRAHRMAKIAADLWVELGGKLIYPTETNFVWLDLEASGLDPEYFFAMTEKFNVKIWDVIRDRVVFHYQISDSAFARLCNCFKAILEPSHAKCDERMLADVGCR